MNVSTRIIFSVLLLLAVVAASMLLGGRIIMNRVETGLFSITQNSQLSAMQAVLNSNESVLAAHARTVGRERDAIKALADGDADTASDVLASTFNRISAAGDVTGLHVYALDGTPLVTLSDTSPSTSQAPKVIARVLDSNRRVFGIDQLDGDQFASVFAFPILAGRQTVAIAVLSKTLSKSLPAIANTIGGATILVTDNGARSQVRTFASSEHTTVGQAVQGQTEGTESASSALDLEYATKLADQVQSAASGKPWTVGKLQSYDRTYIVSRNVLGSTPSGSDVSILLVANYTEQAAERANAILQFTLATLGLMALLMTFAYFWYRKQFQPLVQTISILSKFQNGERDVKISLADRNDEFGVLGQALVDFRDQMQATERLEAERAHTEAAQKEIEMQRLEEQKIREREKREAEAEKAEQEKERLEKEQVIESQRADEIAKHAEQQKVIVDSLGEALNGLSSGNLNVEITARFPEDYEQLRLNFNSAVIALNNALSGVLKNAFTIHGEVEEISSAATELSGRTEKQAATLEQTAAALQQMTASVKSTADGAAEATAFATVAQQKAFNGNKVARSAMDEMASIQKSSTEISKITSVIDDIAFQTNLLALNAGVEAARAGEAGRGFAVVATEVRALAQRSAEAAKEINEQVNGSELQIERGVEMVEKTSTALEEIVQSVEDINHRIIGISTAATEQASGLGEINNAMNNLDNVTQQNVAMFEETTAATHSLKMEANALNLAIEEFELGRNHGSQHHDVLRAS